MSLLLVIVLVVLILALAGGWRGGVVAANLTGLLELILVHILIVVLLRGLGVG
jgi:hypothetical protein